MVTILSQNKTKWYELIISKKIYIDEMLKACHFYVDYAESGGWGPCANNFFEVWKRAVV